MVFWLLNALSKEYTASLEYKVEFTNLPIEKYWLDYHELPKKLSLKINSFGFSILRQKTQSFSKKLKIDYKELELQYPDKRDSLVHFTLFSNQLKEINNQLGRELKILSCTPDTIYFKLSIPTRKKLPVKSKIELAFEKQFRQKEGVKFIPDSVIVSGPKAILDTMKGVYTNYRKFEKINSSFQATFELDKGEYLFYNEQVVKGIVEVENYTEKVIKVPITFLDLPPDFKLKLFPKYVNLAFLVGLSDYYNIQSSEFEVSVSYKDIKYATKPPKHLKVSLKSHPAKVQVIRFFPKNVEYILEK